MNVTCEKYTKNGKTHLRVLDFKAKCTPKRVNFYFENLIDGNELLSNEVLKALNENGLAIFAEIEGTMQEVMGAVWTSALNEVSRRVALEDLFLP